MLLGDDPNRRRWPSLKMPGAASTAVSTAVGATTAVSSADAASTAVSTAVGATTAVSTAVSAVAAVAAAVAAATAEDRVCEHQHQRWPGQSTRQHHCRPHRPCPRHLHTQRRAQHHQERRP